MNYEAIKDFEIKEQIKILEQVGAKSITKIDGTSVTKETLINEYYGNHDILNKADKPIYETETQVVGNEKREIDKLVGTVEVAKIPIPYQMKIVDIAAAFFCGKPIELINVDGKNSKKFNEFKEMLVNDAEFNSKNLDLMKHLFIETIAAKLYFIKNPTEKAKRKLSSRVLCKEYGDDLYVNINNVGTIDAILRKFVTQDIVDGKVKTVTRYELYLENSTKYYKQEGNDIVEEKVDNHNYGEIPVVPYVQKYAEFEQVRNLVKKYEESFSQLHDTNDYFSAPAAKIKGEIESMPNKSEQGKIFELKQVQGVDGKPMWSDVEYVTWDQRSESLKMQFDIADTHIYSITQTPDISFNKLLAHKPGNISGAALKFMMLDPSIKATSKQMMFTPNIKKELEIAKIIASKMGVNVIDTEINIEYQSILPDNLIEIIEMLSTATNNKQILSRKKALEHNPMIENTEAELNQIVAEEKEDLAGGGTLNL